MKRILAMDDGTPQGCRKTMQIENVSSIEADAR